MAILDLTGNLPDVQRTMHLFLTVQAAVTPTSVLPAPEKLHSKTRILHARSPFLAVIYFTFAHD
jgi:hypothetical protein